MNDSSTEEAIELETTVAQRLHAAIPAGSDTIELYLARIRGLSYGYTRAFAQGQHTEGLRVDPDLLGTMRGLRKAMYRPGKGTWLSVTVTVEQSGRYRFSYNYDTEPEWKTPPDDSAYTRDFELYPRDPEATPDWLQRKIEHGRQQLHQQRDDT